MSFLVDGVPHQASTVRVAQLGTNGGGFPPSALPTYGRILGESTPVFIGGGRYIFGLMAGYETVDGKLWRSDTFSLPKILARRTSAYVSYDGEGRSEFLDKLEKERVSLRLQPSEWPMLGFFRDVAVKETATLLPFADIGDVFPGVSALAATLETTNDKVTRGHVAEVLPWFQERPFNLSNAPSLDLHPERLVPSDFIR